MNLYMLCFIFLFAGVYCILSKRNVVKMLLGTVIAQYAVSLFFALISYANNNALTRIIHSIIFSSFLLILVALAICVRIYKKTETSDISKLKQLRG